MPRHASTHAAGVVITKRPVYEYVPLSLWALPGEQRRQLPWNTANRMFQPILSALGLINSLGVSHLGISPDTCG